MAAVEYAKTKIREDRAELARKLSQLTGDLAVVGIQYDQDGYWAEQRDEILGALRSCYEIMDLCDRIDLLEEVANAG